MNEPGNKAKQQIIDKIKSSTNILVTVSRDPTVDDLSAAIGLTAMLNNMGKHATAIFSGTIPPAITFLEPDKVFEGTADSLRDFIIALDKEKADHLRYKIDGDVVKIFITPYRTTITSDDLEFTQGDFNVEIVLALGVAHKDHLDTAISSQGQIIHDVTIATLTAGEQVSNLGSIDWHEDSASSLSEMVVGLSDSLKTDKQLLDKQISTALLTGIVFATDRFSNTRTTAKVMTMAAQLMAAGADQQLIAAKLNELHEINSSTISSIKNMSESSGLVDMPIDVDRGDSPPAEASAPVDDATTLKVDHGSEEELIPPTSTLTPEQEAEMNAQAQPQGQSAIISPINDTTNSLQSAEAEQPLLGGTLNATTDQAADDNRRQNEDQKNKTILSHSYLVGSEPDVGTAINSAAQATEAVNNIDIFASPPAESRPEPAAASAIDPKTDDIAAPIEYNSMSTLPPVATEQVSTLPPAISESDLGLQQSVPEMSTLPPVMSAQEPMSMPASLGSRDSDEAMMAVESAFGAQLPASPLVVPSEGLPLPPPLPDFSVLPPQPTPFDYSAASLAAMPSAIAEQPVIDDPAQFKIPG